MERGKAESVAWLNHLNHRLSQHNSRENAENLKCVTIMASSQGLFTGINRGNELNEHNFISPEKERKGFIRKCFILHYKFIKISFTCKALMQQNISINCMKKTIISNKSY